MADFGTQRDLQSVNVFTNAAAKFDIGFEATFQTVVNESAVVMEVSWDGVNVHAILDPALITTLVFEAHKRKTVWIKRQSGSGGGPHNVQLLAGTQ